MKGSAAGIMPGPFPVTGLWWRRQVIEKNGPQKMLGFKPNYNPENIKAFFTDVSGWGTFEQTRNTVGSVTTQADKVSVKYGTVNLRTLQFYFPENLLSKVFTVQATVQLNGSGVSATTTVTGNQVKLTLASDTPVNAGSNIQTTITVTDTGAQPTPTVTPQPTPTPAVKTIPTNGLQMRLKFDETTGTTAADSSGSGNYGTLVNTPLWIPDGGRFGGALCFDGVDAWVNIPNFSLTGDFTLAAWVSIPGNIGNQDAIAGQEGTGQDINFFAQKLRIYDGSDKIIANTALLPDFWTHCAITRTAGTLRLYMNGLLDATSGASWTGGFIPKAVGRGNAGFFGGKIDDLVLYNRVLTDAEIQTLAASTATLFSDGFESNNYTAGGWTNSGCTIQSTYKYAGTYANCHNLSDSLTKSLSTAGYKDIQSEIRSLYQELRLMII